MFLLFHCVSPCCDNLTASELGITILCIYTVIVTLKVDLHEVNFAKSKMAFSGLCRLCSTGRFPFILLLRY